MMSRPRVQPRLPQSGRGPAPTRPHGCLIPNDSGCHRLSVGHVQHERNRRAAREIDLFNSLSRSYQHHVAFERYGPEVGREQIKIC
jgi:hypothetical protein